MDSGTYRTRNTSMPFSDSEKNGNTSLPDVIAMKTSKSNASTFSENSEYTFENGVFEKKKGLSWPITGRDYLFVLFY